MAAPFLTVRAIRTIAVEVPMARPLGTSAQTMRTAPILLIDLDTEEGITGHANLFCYTRMAPALVATVLADIQDAVRGERPGQSHFRFVLERWPGSCRSKRRVGAS
jgi:mandelate racemase